MVMGFAHLAAYENKPGIAASPSLGWPTGSQIPRPQGVTTLILFAHPRCPCTRASLGELAILMAQCEGRLRTHVLLVRGKNEPRGWEKTDLWTTAAAIPGVTVSSDEDGAEAERFHAQTSGECVVYDAQGQRIFHGGITAVRGHAGDNAGRSAITALVMTGTADRATTPTFGCSLSGRPAKIPSA